MKIRLSSPLQPDSIVDGPGIRTVIWFQGCMHNCKGCHNPETHSFYTGTLVDIEEIKKELLDLKGQDGITLSGGDPMFQIDAALEIAKFSKQLNLNVWCYTGFTFEKLLEKKKTEKNLQYLLNYIDVLVDGKFEEEQRSLDLFFRGSKNQRVLDLQESLKHGAAIEMEEYKESDFDTYSYGRTEYMYI